MTTAFWYNHLQTVGFTAKWHSSSGPLFRWSWNMSTMEDRSKGSLGQRSAHESGRGLSRFVPLDPLVARSFLRSKQGDHPTDKQRIGYRLQVPEITWPRTVRKGEKFTIKSRWANAGVAPCYGVVIPVSPLRMRRAESYRFLPTLPAT